jgi:HEXXH motif-containing protein
VRIPQSGAINEVIALSSTIHVDLDSPYNRGDVDRRFATQQAAAPDAHDRIVTSLRGALDIIAMASPTAHRFTEAFTTIVVCIHVPDLDDRIGSFSSSWYPGRSVLVNAHHMDVDELADSLLHEAIHSVIDVSELTGRMLRRPPVPGTTVTSPWTGATLTLEALLDAYFVWYGLMWLWQRSANSASPRDGVDDRIAQCRKGFVPTLDAVVGDARDAVHGATADAIEGLRAAVSFECAM